MPRSTGFIPTIPMTTAEDAKPLTAGALNVDSKFLQRRMRDELQDVDCVWPTDGLAPTEPGERRKTIRSCEAGALHDRRHNTEWPNRALRRARRNSLANQSSLHHLD